MSYTQNEVVSQTSDITSSIYIFSSATDSTYANDPFCRVLDLMGRGWVYRGAGGDAYAYVLSGGTICSGIIEYPGRLYASAGATVTDMTIDGHTYICDPRAATGVARDDITLNRIRNTGNVEFVMRGSNVKAYDIAVQGKKTAIQNGAYVVGLHISGGTATMEFNTGTVVDSNATAMIGSDFNVSAGALNVSAGAGKTINIYGLNANAGAAVTIGHNVLAHLQSGNVANDVYTSNGYLLVSAGAQLRGGSIDAGTIHVYADALASGVTVNGGTLNASNGAEARDIVLNGGTLSVKAGGLASGGTINGGSVDVSGVFRGGAVNAGGFVTVNAGGVIDDVDIAGTGTTQLVSVGTGATGTNLRLSAGRINNYGSVNGLTVYAGYNYTFGGSISGLAVSGGSATIQRTAAVNDDVTVNEGALLNVYNATVTNLTQNGGTVSAVSAANFAATYLSGATIAGGSAVLTAGASGADIEVGGGELQIMESANVVGATLTGGMTRVSGGALLRDVDVRGAGTTGVASVYAGATAENIRISAGRVDNYGTVKNLTVYAGYNYTFGGSISGLAVSGGSATIQRTSAANDDVTVETGGLLNVYNATVTGLTQNGGTVSAVSAANYAATLLSGATIAGGSAVLTAGASGADIEVGGGELQIMESANVVGATLTGGMTRVSGGALLRDVDVRGAGTTGVASVYAGATAEDIRLSAGRVDNYGTVRNLTVYAGYNYTFGGSISGLAVSGGSATIQRTSAANDDVTVETGALLNIYNAEVTNLTQNGGTVSAVSAGTFAAPRITGAEIAGGTAELTAGASGSNIRLGGGLLNITNATVKDLVQTGGKVVAASNADLAEAYISNAVVSGGTMTVGAGALAEEVRVLGTAFVYGSASNVVQSGGSVQIFAGGSVTDFTQDADGKLIVYGGGIAGNVAVGKSAVIYDSSLISGASVADGATLTVSVGGLLEDAEVSGSAFVRGSASGVTQYAGRIDVNNGVASNFNVSGGYTYFYQATVDGIAVYDGSATIQNTSAANLTVYGGLANIYTDISDIAQAGGSVYIADGATVTGLNATGGKVGVANGGVLSAKAGNTVNDLTTIAGAKFNFTKDGAGATLTGSNTNIAEGTLYYSGAQLAATAVNGVLTGLNAGTVYKLSIGDGILVNDVTLNNGEIRISCFDGASVDGATVSAGAIVCNAGAYGTLDNVTLVGAGIMNLSGTAQANDTVVSNGGQFALNAATVKAENTVLKAGAKFNINAAGADTGDKLTLDVSGGTSISINYLDRVAAHTEIVLKGETAGNTYTIATTGSTDKYVNCGEWGLYDDRIKAGETITNAFTGFSYAFNATGTAITVDAVTVGTKTGAAAALTSDDAITGGRAVKWDSATGVTSGNVFLAGDMTSGQAWVELDGYAGGANTTLYGAQGSSFATGTVNVYAKSGSLRNLAAGANAGGTVAAVNLTVAGAELDGTGYAGGFGNVTGAVKTLVSTGTITKDFYAGALANKLDSVTSVGNVSMTVDGGTFSGNIYGASAVKTVAGKNGTRHTAGDVTLTITDGETTKGTQSCIFAGGYATGDATGTVYTVDSVNATISGGSWGEAAGGRGVFGGIMASGVEAQVLGDVNITISGDATMGNVFGGGWAQKNGTSIVGDVRINIAGGTIANVFGGGSHSTSGGATTADAVTITVSGGTITSDIYARGQLAGDSVTSAKVVFTGAENFACGVYGYTATTGEVASDATLSFTDYTGTFSGKLGGFNGITLDQDTAANFGAGAVVANTAWTFDAAARDAALCGTAFLNWDAADFASNTVTLNLATGDANEWTLINAATDTAYGSFTLQVDGDNVATGLDLGQAIENTGTAYDGWGFTRENDVLKFAQITA